MENNDCYQTFKDCKQILLSKFFEKNKITLSTFSKINIQSFEKPDNFE